MHALPSADLSWDDFKDYLLGLLAADTRLGRQFAASNGEGPAAE